MEQPIHLATLDSPGLDAPTACGAPRDVARWTTSPEQATCLVCRLRWVLAAEARLAAARRGVGHDAAANP